MHHRLLRIKTILTIVFVALLALGCRQSEPKIDSVSIHVINEHTGAPVPLIDVFVDGELVDSTDVLGRVLLSQGPDEGVISVGHPGWTLQVEHAYSENTTHYQRWLATRNFTTEEQKGLELLADLQNTLGILPSVPGGTLISTYDQALAALSFTLAGEYEKAKAIFDFFDGRRTSELNQGPGGFHQFRNLQGQPLGNRWLGDNAWLLIALQVYNRASPGEPEFTQLILDLDTWIRSQEDPVDGGLWGGTNEAGQQIHKITEGNIDAVAALVGYDALHEGILAYLQTDRWNDTLGVFRAWPGNPDYEYALDCATWGFCALPEMRTDALSHVERFSVSKTSANTGATMQGYCFDEDGDVLWLEGTGQVAVMNWAAEKGQKAAFILGEMEKGWTASTVGGGLPYSANSGTGYGSDPLWSTAHTLPCISSTAWYLMAASRFNPMWLSKLEKNINAGQIYWN
ncbi:MAG: hypothetical protein RL754_1310 [Bacteroidota bacterium]